MQEGAHGRREQTDSLRRLGESDEHLPARRSPT
jgi:hypothetical protein